MWPLRMAISSMPITFGPGVPARTRLRAHVLLVQRLDRVPVEIELLGNVLDRCRAAAPTHVMGKALGVERVVRQKLELLALHGPATSTPHTPHLDLQIDAPVATREIAYLAHAPVVPARVHSAALAACGFFERRTRVMTRALGSPKTPRTVGRGRNPGNAYASHSRRARFDKIAMRTCSQFQASLKTPIFTRLQHDLSRQFTHTTS